MKRHPFSPVSALFLPRVYHGGLPWQPQKWPVRALGNVDVQIMTCWKPWTTSLSPAGNWFFYQFIVSSCTAHHWYSYFSNRGRVREKETVINMNIFMCTGAYAYRLQVHISQRVYVFALINDYLLAHKLGFRERRSSLLHLNSWKTHGALYLSYLASGVSNFAGAEQDNPSNPQAVSIF